MAEGAGLTAGEVVARLGPPARIREGLAEFRRNARAFSSDRPRLIERYRRQWVAVLGGDVVAHGDSFSAVIEAIDRTGLPRADVMVRFIDEDTRTMIL